jgi:chemotaxis protein MotA
MDFGTIGGIIFAIALILVGQALEGGHVSSILQATAALIVFGGTFGAVAVSFPLNEFFRGLKMGLGTLTQKKNDLKEILDKVVDLAGVARRDGVLALEQRLPELKDPFLRRAVGFIVDGVDATVARDSLETEIMHKFEEGTVSAKVFDSLGGYAPTVGILGAVLGLIHVMENLNDPSKLGGGIATAFCATVYGVGAANLIFLPIGTKIKRRIAIEKERRVLIAEAALSIQAGLNPRVLREKLLAYAGIHEAPEAKKD